MKYRAIFFDRDGTLTYFNPKKEKWRNEIIAHWSGKPFELPYDKMMNLFQRASEGKKPWYNNIDDENDFFRRYYHYLLVGEGVKDDTGKKACLLFNELWCNDDRLPYPDVVPILDYFKARGFKLGVISDSSPSLELTLRQIGLAECFTSFTASYLVGAGKPSPVIFNAAIKAQGVTARESLYVDDTKLEADGARAQGFTAFHIDRTINEPAQDEWTISSLKELVPFVVRQAET